MFCYVEYACIWNTYQRDTRGKSILFVILYLLDSTIYFIGNWFSPSLYTITTFLFMMGSIFYFSKNKKISILYSAIWVFFLAFDELASSCIVSVVNQIPVEYLLENTISYFEINAITRIIQLIFVFIVKHYFIKKNKNRISLNSISILIVLLGSSVSLIWYFEIIYKYKVVTELSEFMMILMIMIVTDIIVYILYEKQERVIEIQAQNQALRQYIDAQQIEYQHHMEITEKERIIRHDMKNYMLLLKSYALEQDTHKIIELVDEKFNKLEYEREQIHTGNKYLDIILSNKIRMAESQNIKVSTDIQTLGVIHIDSEDLIVMIGNLFDNAIEAATQCVEKKIEIMIRFEKQMFVFSINNSVSKPVVLLKGGEIRSTKKEPGHGIGIPSVHRLAMKYDGDLTLSNKDNMFYVKLVLFDRGE